MVQPEHGKHGDHKAAGGAMKPEVAAAASAGVGAKALMNVLFLVVDDLRYQMGYQGPGVRGPGCPNHMADVGGCKGMHTPNIDKLAHRSLTLQKNYAQLSLCSPSRTSVLSGRRPETTRVYDLHSYFRDTTGNITTLPQFFKEHGGYVSYSLGKIYHPGSASGRTATRDDDDSDFSWTSKPYHPPTMPDKYAATFREVSPEQEHQYGGLPETQLADTAVKVLSLQMCGRPTSLVPMEESECAKLKEGKLHFFLGVGFERPHLPFVAPKRFYDMYPESLNMIAEHPTPVEKAPDAAWSPSGELCQYKDFQGIRKAQGKAGGMSPGELIPKGHAMEMRRAYYAAVSFVDSEVGKVMNALTSGPFALNTIVAFWGDHGYHLGEGGIWAKQTNFEVAAHSPLMIHAPGITDRGIRSLAYTEHIDIFPTLVELATGVEVPECHFGEHQRNSKLCTMGKSLVPLMHAAREGEVAFNRERLPPHFTAAYSQNNRDRNDASDSSPSDCLTGNGNCTMGYSVVTNLRGHEFRYTEWVQYHEHQPKWEQQEGVELYDHTHDVETVNVAGDHKYASVVKFMSKLLRRGPLKGGGWGPWQTGREQESLSAEVEEAEAALASEEVLR